MAVLCNLGLDTAEESWAKQTAAWTVQKLSCGRNEVYATQIILTIQV